MANDRIVVNDDGIELMFAARGRTPAWTAAFPWAEIHSVDNGAKVLCRLPNPPSAMRSHRAG